MLATCVRISQSRRRLRGSTSARPRPTGIGVDGRRTPPPYAGYASFMAQTRTAQARTAPARTAPSRTARPHGGG
jgi:hypothetical protein